MQLASGVMRKLFESGLGSTLKPLRSWTGSRKFVRSFDRRRLFPLPRLHLFFDLQIRWSARLEQHGLERCLVTVDGTDNRIPEPSPLDTRWYSHKFKGPGLRYEIAVCIRTGKIVSYNGPFECGRWPDLNIFRNKLKGMLTVGEKVGADNGYKGDDKVLTPNDSINDVHKKAMSNARARHETINRRLKTWGILKQVFRSKLAKHHIAFRSVLVLEEIAIENGHPPFQVAHMGDLLAIWSYSIVF